MTAEQLIRITIGELIIQNCILQAKVSELEAKKNPAVVVRPNGKEEESKHDDA